MPIVSLLPSQVACRGAADGASDLPVSTDTLGGSAGLVRTVAFLSFWVQLPLTVVSAGILLFAVQFSNQVRVLLWKVVREGRKQQAAGCVRHTGGSRALGASTTAMEHIHTCSSAQASL
jgi:hypothetical protein